MGKETEAMSPRRIRSDRSGQRVRAALYIDFDNVFSGLMDLDEEAAIAFAQAPREWLDRLALTGHYEGSYRDFLIRRCYLNPAGWKLSDQGGGTHTRLYFSKFRPFLTRAGFEVVDCPALTSQSKNASDIRIALDILDALRHPTQFDEFVLFSGDADFTPVLQRVREHDRRTVVVSSSQTAKAYEATVDIFLQEQDLIELIRPEIQLDTESGIEETASLQVHSAPVTLVPNTAPSSEEVESLRERAVDITLEMIDGAKGPVGLANLATAIRSMIGQVVNESDWFNRGSLSAAIVDDRTSHLERSNHYIWDPSKHAAPTVRSRPQLPDDIEKIAAVTGMPRLTHEEYRAVFTELGAWVQENSFNLTAITREVRDRLHNKDWDIGRQTLGFIVRGAMYGGVPLNRQPPPSAQEIAQAFLQSSLQSAASAQLELSDEEQMALSRWLLPD